MAQRHVGIGAVVIMGLAVAASAAEARAPAPRTTLGAVRTATVVTSQVRAHAASVATIFRARTATPDVAPIGALALAEHDRADPWTRAPVSGTSKRFEPKLALDVHDPWSGEEYVVPARDRIGLDVRDPWSGEPLGVDAPLREPKQAMLLRTAGAGEPQASADDAF